MTNQSFSSPISSSNELAGLQRRRDLRFQQIDSLRWNVLDPISRQSYRIGLIEHWLLTRPDGRASVDQLLKRLRDEFPRMAMSNEQLLACLTTFLRNGLLWSRDLVGTNADNS
ncbi:MAG: hypothetical protein KDA51_15130, partial [Planctomycetales bacterium]|nr:hypothetical protein [Planctomycetales bacterium]